MANHAVEEYKAGPADAATVLAALHAKLETFDTAKTIRLITIIPTGRDRDQCIGFLLYDT